MQYYSLLYLKIDCKFTFCKLLDYYKLNYRSKITLLREKRLIIQKMFKTMIAPSFPFLQCQDYKSILLVI